MSDDPAALSAALESARESHRAGDLTFAAREYQRIVDVDPTNAEAHFLLGVVAVQTGRHDRAIEHLTTAIGAAPADGKAYNALGAAYFAKGRLSDAIEAFRAAAEFAPELPDAMHNLARALHADGRLEEAEAILRPLAGANPEAAEIQSDLGSIYHGQKRLRDAEACFRRALDLSPGLPEAERNLAGMLNTQGRCEEARLLAPRIRDDLARFMLATTTPAIPPDTDAIVSVEREYLAALEAVPALKVDNPLEAFASLGHFYFAYYDRPLRAIHEATAQTYRRLCPSLGFTAAHCARPSPRRPRPRVGFASSHFSSHTIGRLFSRMVVGLADRLDVVALAGPGGVEGNTGRIDGVVPVVRLPTNLARAQRTVAELEADALVYLDIGMEPFTYFLAHARLAPLQLVTWGHPVTPGLATIDGFVSAAYLDPPGAELDHSEPIHRLAEPAYVFERPQVVRRERGHFGLPDRGRLYVCPQTLFKFHPDFDGTIAEILRADPGGHLVLIAGSVPQRQAALEARLARAMPDVKNRVCFLPALSHADFLSLLAASDVMLDIPSFSGGSTTLEGLAAGVPVVTLPKDHFRGRLTAGLLRLAGLEDGIAETRTDYVRRAVEFANDGAAYRAAIADRAGCLYGRRQAVTDFEALLRELIESHAR